jgi:hypothetical protein
VLCIWGDAHRHPRRQAHARKHSSLDTKVVDILRFQEGWGNWYQSYVLKAGFLSEQAQFVNTSVATTCSTLTHTNPIDQIDLIYCI